MHRREFVLQCLWCAGLALTVNTGAQAAGLPPKKQVLFVCTGNYYRSRFAEALFNQKAREAHLDWGAISRGLKLVPSQHGISPFAQQELSNRGVSPELCQGEPKALGKEDLEKSDYIVFMDEAEHRPMLEKQFPTRDSRKDHYWHIAESGRMNPAKACQAMAANIGELLKTLER
jgi:protein-tyrosine phosphatase